MVRLLILCAAAVLAVLSEISALHVLAAAHNALGVAPSSACAVKATPASSILTATSCTLGLTLQRSVRHAASRATPYASSVMNLRGGQAEDKPPQFTPEWHEAMRDPAPPSSASTDKVDSNSTIPTEDINNGCDSCGKNFSLSGNVDTHELCKACGNYFEPEVFESTHVYQKPVVPDGGLPVEVPVRDERLPVQVAVEGS